MVRAMGHRWFGSKAASGLCQALVALMPPHAVYIETHPGGGAVMKRKPAALRSIANASTRHWPRDSSKTVSGNPRRSSVLGFEQYVDGPTTKRPF